MKKLAALVLALVLALAAIPALGEGTDVSGTWYMTMAGVTVGSVELQEDSTLKYTVIDETYEGTWAGTFPDP